MENYNRWLMRFTVSGCPEPGSIEVLLDGVPLTWNSKGLEDRSFYEFYVQGGFSRGSHSISFRQLFSPSGNFKRQLCSLTIHEYKNEPQFNWQNYISAYRLWRQGGAMAGYRPTNELCLMRNMSSPKFCEICIENNWLHFFRSVNLIDNITAVCNNLMVTVTLDVIPIGMKREKKLLGGESESYEVTWYRNNIEVPELKDMYKFEVQRANGGGNWKAELHYVTSMIRYDPLGLTYFEKTINIPATGPCD